MALLALLVTHLLTAYWILAIGAVLVTITPVPVPQAFKDAVRLSAARGKLWSTRPRSLSYLQVGVASRQQLAGSIHIAQYHWCISQVGCVVYCKCQDVRCHTHATIPYPLRGRASKLADGYSGAWSVPQSWFAHFYAIGLVCCSLVLVMAPSPDEGKLSDKHQGWNMLMQADAAMLECPICSLFNTGYSSRHPPGLVPILAAPRPPPC
ncbi:S5A_REDUCTASE domain-containing protein [Haematococcus lacustris]|uniref:S5A_REDUCTASE domain-containing protein n=1 Tax=Haematococcus lacustris TaxID=44745 RepID=A0A699YNH1_HAELA|nr:S5A_REDUCTASE domain-containing protein [Haematococcus lacustris]